MMRSDDTSPNRLALALTFLATAAYVAAGYAVSLDMGETWPIGAALVVGTILLAFLAPAAGVSAVLLSAPTMYDLHPMPVGEFSLLELAILTSAAGITLRLLLKSVRTGFGQMADVLAPAHVVVPVGLLLLASALALLTLADPGHRTESLREVRTVIIAPLLFLAAARMVLRDRESRFFAGAMLVLGGTVLAAYAAAQIFLDVGGVQAGDVTRATGTYTHPNNLALFLERTVLFTIGVGVVRPRWWPVWLLTAIQVAGLLLTFSRGAFIALAAGIALLLLLRGLYKWLLLLIAGGVGVVVFGLVLFPERLIDAGGSGAEPTRFTIWRASWRMLLDHPIFGVGPDQFLYQYSRRYIEPMGWPERYTSHPHNILLDTWLRLGVAGMAALVSVVIGMVWWIWRHFRAVRSDALAMGAIAALAGGLAHGMVDNGFFLPDLATLTWFFIAVIITIPIQRAAAVPRSSNEEREAMETTWPVADRSKDGPGRSERERPREGATWSIAIMAVLFLLGPLLSDNPYLPFVMIALVGLTTFIDPTLGIAAVVLSIPVQDVFVLPFVRGELTFTQVALFGLVLGWAVTFYRYRIWLDSIVLGFVAVFAAFSISLVEMDSPGSWFGEVYRWAAAAIVYIIARGVLVNWQRVRTVLYAVALAVIGTGLHVLYVMARRIADEQAVSLDSLRAMGTFNVPNPLAAYIEFTVPVLLVFALAGFQHRLRERVGRTFWLTSILASGSGLLTLGLTQSRGGWIGMAAALLIVFFILPRRTLVTTVAIGIVLVGGFLLTPVGQSQLERFSGAIREEPSPVREVHGGTWGRASLWEAGILMIEDEPFTGIGAGEYDYHYRQYVPEWIDRFPRGQAHNGWLQMGAQAGLPGIIAFTIWLAASIVAVAGAARRATDEVGHLLAWGTLAVLVAFTLHSLVDYLNVLSLGLQLSVVTAIGLALAPDPLRSVHRLSKRAFAFRRGVAEANVGT